MLALATTVLLLFPSLPELPGISSASLAAVLELSPSAKLGRKNPFQPLIGRGAVPTLPGAPRLSSREQTASASDPADEDLRLLGIAYDARDTVAAARVGGRTVFLRRGDRVQGGLVVAVLPDRLVWRRAQQTYTTLLSRPAGAR